MRLAVTYPDVEALVVDYLTAALAGEGCTVSVGVPQGWTTASPDHLEVALDGTPRVQHPMVAHCTVRLSARSRNTTRAKALVILAQGRLAAALDAPFAARVLTGCFPARDPQTFAEIASNTTRVSIRSVPLEPSGS